MSLKIELLHKINRICEVKQDSSYLEATAVLNDLIEQIFIFCVGDTFLEAPLRPLQSISCIEIAKIQIGPLIGRGAFGSVFEGLHRGKRVAVKINKSVEEDSDSLSEIINEAKHIKMLNEIDKEEQYSIVKMNESGFLDPKIFFIIMPLYEMDLHTFLYNENQNGIPLNVICTIARTLLKTLNFFSELKIIHGDLKLQNILIERSSELKLSISDFGSAQTSPQENTHCCYLTTRPYRAPQIVLGRQYDDSIDRWAVGCILFELHTKTTLFNARKSSDLLTMFSELMGPIPKSCINFSIWGGRLVTCLHNSDLYLPIRTVQSRHESTLEIFSRRLTPHSSVWSIRKATAKFHTKELYESFKSLLSQIFTWHSSPSSSELLKHPFFKMIDSVKKGDGE
jgi:serine/threonine protein kinase